MLIGGLLTLSRLYLDTWQDDSVRAQCSVPCAWNFVTKVILRCDRKVLLSSQSVLPSLLKLNIPNPSIGNKRARRNASFQYEKQLDRRNRRPALEKKIHFILAEIFCFLFVFTSDYKQHSRN